MLDSLIHNTIQCWGCPVFDRLFNIVSMAAAEIYHTFAIMCILIFGILLAFYFLNAFMENNKSDKPDSMYLKYIKPIFINTVLIFGLLGLGIQFPRLISKITFEPVADMTLLYTQTMLQTDTDTVNQKVVYQPTESADGGFFSNDLRDKIIMIMKTTITQFQSYIKLGMVVIERAFSWDALTSFGMLFKHIIIFAMGLYLIYAFFTIFIKFCFYFADVIVAMAYFAFFFPMAMIMYIFSNASSPGWIKNLASGISMPKHIKAVISSIVSLAAMLITYTIMMVIIAKFFSANGTDVNGLMTVLLSGDIYADDLNTENLAAITLTGCVVLVYVLNYLMTQIKSISGMIMSAFEIEDNKNKIGDQMFNDVKSIGEKAFEGTKKIIGAVMGTTPDEDKPKTQENKS